MLDTSGSKKSVYTYLMYWSWNHLLHEFYSCGWQKSFKSRVKVPQPDGPYVTMRDYDNNINNTSVFFLRYFILYYSACLSISTQVFSFFFIYSTTEINRYLSFSTVQCEWGLRGICVYLVPHVWLTFHSAYRLPLMGSVNNLRAKV